MTTSSPMSRRWWKWARACARRCRSFSRKTSTPTGAGCASRRRRTMTKTTAIRCLSVPRSRGRELPVTGYYEKLRLVGAQTRKILLANAADRLERSSRANSRTEPGMVVHAWSTAISYGDIAKTATVPNPVPEATKADLKPSSECHFIGRDAGRSTFRRKSTAPRSTASTRNCPACSMPRCCSCSAGEKPEPIHDAAAKAVKGVTKIRRCRLASPSSPRPSKRR